VRVGQVAVAIGNSLGTLGGTVTHGVVSARNREITIEGQRMTLMQTSAAVNPGNSGGGLFNANGELIGVVNAKGTGVDVEGLGFAIPSNLALQVTSDIISLGYVGGRPILGIQVLHIIDERSAEYHDMEGLGVFITEVTRENGLQVNDQILYIDGVEVETAEQVARAVRALRAGDTMLITVLRDGEVIEVQSVLGEQVPESARANMSEPDND